MIFRYLRRRKYRKRELPPAWLGYLEEHVSFFADLEGEQRERFLEYLKIFVWEKYFIAAGGMEITEEVQVVIAAAAVRLVVHLDISEYNRLTEIIVYPSHYHHPDDDEMEVEVDLTPGAGAPTGSESEVEIQRLATGKIILKINACDLPAGSYDIVIGGIVRGPLVLVDDGEQTEGETKFETNPNQIDELLLDFDVFEEPVALEQGGVVFFSGTIPMAPVLPGGGEGGGGPDSDPVVVSLTSAAGLPAEAKAAVEVDFGLLGPVGIEVEVEDLPAGDYDLIIGDVTRATLVVALTDGDLRGQLGFAAEPGGPGELALDFLVAGKVISIVQAGTEIFSGVIPVSPPEN